MYCLGNEFPYYKTTMITSFIRPETDLDFLSGFEPAALDVCALQWNNMHTVVIEGSIPPLSAISFFLPD